MKPTFLRKLALSVTLLVTGLLVVPAWGSPESDADQKLITELRQRTSALQKKILATSDPAEQARLQKQIPLLVEEILPKLSPKARVPMQVALKLVQPIQQAGADYMQKIADFSSSPDSDFTTLKAREEIKPRLAMIAELNEMNEGLINQLENFETSADKMLDESSLNPLEKREFKAGLTQGFGRRIGPMKAIRTLDTRMFEIFTAALQHLDLHWGKWKVTPGKPITWDAEAADAEFQAMMKELGVLAERQGAAQAVLSQRL